jgi:hypothetical protein
MPAFTPVGVQATVKGVREFERDLGKMGKSVNDQAKSTSKFGDAALEAGRFLAGFGASVAAVATIVKKALDFGREGAVVQQTTESFATLLSTIGASPGLLNELRDASRGTIPDLQLMSSTATLLAGVSNDLALRLANATPELLEIAKAASKLNPSLGDTAFLYQSIATGVKRASPLILDNLGILVKVGEANERFAKSLGKTVDELTAEERAMALLNATLEAGDNLIAQAGGTTAAITDDFDRLNASLANVSNEMKTKFVPILSDAAQGLDLLLAGNKRVVSALEQHEQEVAATAESYEEYVTEVTRALVASGKATDEFGKLTEQQLLLGQVTDLVVNETIREYNIQTREQFEASQAARRAMEEQTLAAQNLAAAEETAEEAQRRLNDELKALNDLIGIQITDSFIEFQDKLASARDREQEILDRMDQLGPKAAAGSTQAQEELAKLQAELDKTRDAISETTAKWDEQTARMIFDLATQRLAIDGLTTEELNALAKLAGPQGFGLVDDAAVALIGSIGRAADEMDAAGDQSGEFVGQLRGLHDELNDSATAAGNLAGNLGNIKSKSVTITTNFVSRGTPAGAPVRQQHGGPLARFALVGEAGPELIINGVVIPAPMTRALMNLGLGKPRGFQAGGVLPGFSSHAATVAAPPVTNNRSLSVTMTNHVRDNLDVAMIEQIVRRTIALEFGS